MPGQSRRWALGEVYNAEDREHAEKAAQAFANDYGINWPKTAAKITDDLDVLLAFLRLSGPAL